MASMSELRTLTAATNLLLKERITKSAQTDDVGLHHKLFAELPASPKTSKTPNSQSGGRNNRSHPLPSQQAGPSGVAGGPPQPPDDSSSSSSSTSPSSSSSRSRRRRRRHRRRHTRSRSRNRRRRHRRRSSSRSTTTVAAGPSASIKASIGPPPRYDGSGYIDGWDGWVINQSSYWRLTNFPKSMRVDHLGQCLVGRPKKWYNNNVAPHPESRRMDGGANNKRIIPLPLSY